MDYIRNKIKPSEVYRYEIQGKNTSEQNWKPIHDYIENKKINEEKPEYESPIKHLFKRDWDPIQAYGKIMVAIGISAILAGIITSVSVYQINKRLEEIRNIHLNPPQPITTPLPPTPISSPQANPSGHPPQSLPPQHSQPPQIQAEIFNTNMLIPLILLPIGLVIIYSGINLKNKKESGRILSVFLHYIPFCIPILTFVGFLANAPNTNLFKLLTGILIFGIIMTIMLSPLFLWCVLVIRSLSSPILKYVFIRGGNVIE